MKRIIFFVTVYIFLFNISNDLKAETIADKKNQIEMVHIKAGTFEALPLNDTIYENKEKNNWLKINLTKDYLIGKYEISQKQWKSVMGKWSYYEILEVEKRPSWDDYYIFPPIGSIEQIAYGDDYPVYGITWVEACEFCNKLSIMNGLEPCYKKLGSENYEWNTKANGYRLPTAAEWEYAAGCGTNKNDFFWGNEFDEKYAYPELTFEEKKISSRRAYTEITKSLPNKFGLHNTVGNVWELCWDEANLDKYKQFEKNGIYTDPHSDPDKELSINEEGDEEEPPGKALKGNDNYGIHGIIWNIPTLYKDWRVGLRIARNISTHD